jgi:hypothetical protein
MLWALFSFFCYLCVLGNNISGLSLFCSDIFFHSLGLLFYTHAWHALTKCRKATLMTALIRNVLLYRSTCMLDSSISTRMRKVALPFNLHVGKTVLTSMRNPESVDRKNLVYLEAILLWSKISPPQKSGHVFWSFMIFLKGTCDKIFYFKKNGKNSPPKKSLDVQVLQRSGIVMRSQKNRMVWRSDHFRDGFFLKGIWEGV